jgi:hypothetical protein
MYKVSSVAGSSTTSALVKLARLGCVHPSNFSKVSGVPMRVNVEALADDLARAAKGGDADYFKAVRDKFNLDQSLRDMDNFADPETLSDIGLAGGLAGAGGMAGLLYKNKKDAYNPGALARLFGAKAKGGVDKRTLNALGALGLAGAGAKGYSMLDSAGYFLNNPERLGLTDSLAKLQDRNVLTSTGGQGLKAVEESLVPFTG